MLSIPYSVKNIKRQDTTATVIPCLCSFTALRTLAAELLIRKATKNP